MDLDNMNLRFLFLKSLIPVSINMHLYKYVIIINISIWPIVVW